MRSKRIQRRQNSPWLVADGLQSQPSPLMWEWELASAMHSLICGLRDYRSSLLALSTVPCSSLRPAFLLVCRMQFQYYIGKGSKTAVVKISYVETEETGINQSPHRTPARELPAKGNTFSALPRNPCTFLSQGLLCQLKEPQWRGEGREGASRGRDGDVKKPKGSLQSIGEESQTRTKQPQELQTC